MGTPALVSGEGSYNPHALFRFLITLCCQEHLQGQTLPRCSLAMPGLDLVQTRFSGHMSG